MTFSWYASKTKNKQAVQLIADLAEALASLVEFDGLETTLDPSPRSSLMMSMYNTQKATFVRRMLAERIIPTAQSLFNEFDPDVRNLCIKYVQSTYPNELPKQMESPAEADFAS
jgi:plasmid stabilization system protein ParE